ncbi:Cys/Met metabolism pyridoxal phosphate-dependent enzyme [Trinorchestia longiramus]|nr:Cys/Met metabolism pyridoxal phosphate-dependent enzyme [Trinorchestia longiramus]
MEGFQPNSATFSTRAIHVGNDPEKWNSLAVVPPISLATTFKQDAPAQFKQYEYSRSGNPTRDCLEECIASLEEAKYGLVFASGLAATTTILHMLSAGDHVVTMDDLYGGTNRYFRKIVSRQGISVDFVDTTKPELIAPLLKPTTKLLWLETPTNPTLKVTDISAVVKIAKDFNKDITVVVDNTFLSSYYQRPLTLGADLVLHSCTKYLNGHTDVVMGVICTSSDALHQQLRFLQNAIGVEKYSRAKNSPFCLHHKLSTGGVPSPFDCYLVNRSLKTLSVRMAQHGKNGLAVAQFLEKHPAVEKVLHPGLPSHPQHELAKKQCYGHSGMVTFYIKGNDLNVTKKFFNKLKVFTLAESLGGYESLCELPSLMTHASVSAEERAKLGITDSLVRLSVGLEEIGDIISDLDQALTAAVS